MILWQKKSTNDKTIVNIVCNLLIKTLMVREGCNFLLVKIASRTIEYFRWYLVWEWELLSHHGKVPNSTTAVGGQTCSKKEKEKEKEKLKLVFLMLFVFYLVHLPIYYCMTSISLIFQNMHKLISLII